MSEIPSDIREKAEACWRSVVYDPRRCSGGIIIDAIAAALLAEREKERERCAKLLEKRQRARAKNPDANWEQLDVAAIRQAE